MSSLVQVEIPGLEIYTDRVLSIKSAMNRSLLALGMVLSEAREKFSGHPRSYWEDWLRTCDVTVKTAERSIQAFEIFGENEASLKETTLKAIVVAPVEVKMTIKSALLAGNKITGQDVRDLVKASKTIAPGKTVYLTGDAAQYGEVGAVVEVVGDQVTVQIEDGIYPCFMSELSLKPIEQQTLPIAVKKPTAHSEYQARMVADQVIELRSILFEIWQNPPDDLRSYLSEELPYISTWGDL